MKQVMRLAWIAATGLAGSAMGQDLELKAAPQSGPIYIAGATVHTVSGETIENGLVSFENGVIAAVDSADVLDRVRLAEGVEVIDAAGMHVYPGLFSAESLLGLSEIGAVRASNDFDEVGAVNPEVRAAAAINPDSTIIPVTRSGGVLLAGVFPSGGLVPGRAAVIRLDGWTWEDMTVTDNAGLVIDWPNLTPPSGRWTGKPEEDDLKEAAESVRALDDLFADAVDYLADRAGASTSDLRLEAMAPYLPGEANESPRPVLIEANAVDDITDAVTWCVRRGLRCVIVGGRDAPLCADLLKAHGVAVIVAGTHAFPKRDDSPHDEAYTLPRRLHEAGLRFAISSSERDGNTRNLPHEAGMAARYGLPAAEAVRSITLSPAEIYGIADRYGSIEAGKSATLIVTDGDVLEVRSTVRHAFIDGRRIDLANKQTRLRDKYLEKYRQLDLIKD